MSSRANASGGLWWTAGQQLVRKPGAMLGLCGLLLLIASALLAPWLAPYDPLAQDVNATLLQPDADHWFGTDDLGRDLFSRVLWGGRESLRVGLVGILLALTGGLVIGTIGGYFGGWLDNAIQMLNEIILSFPVVLFLLSIISILGPGLSTMMLALGLAEIPIFARMVRGAVLSIKQRDFVAAAIATGVPASRVMTRHLLPNIIAPIIVFTTIDLGFAILTTSALSYIGLGAQPPSPEWGAMLNQARRFVYDAWWLSVFPGLPILLAVVSINLLGDGLRDALDPKLR